MVDMAGVIGWVEWERPAFSSGIGWRNSTSTERQGLPLARRLGRWGWGLLPGSSWESVRARIPSSSKLSLFSSPCKQEHEFEQNKILHQIFHFVLQSAWSSYSVNGVTYFRGLSIHRATRVGQECFLRLSIRDQLTWSAHKDEFILEQAGS